MSASCPKCSVTMPILCPECFQRMTERLIEADVERFIAESVGDSDLAVMSAEYRAGYMRGVREMSTGFVTMRLKQMGVKR